MPPKARNAPRGKAAAAEKAPVALPLKRGRAPKEDAADVVAEPPKKRGRPAKAKPTEPVAEDAPEPKKRGRPSKSAPEPVIEAPVVKKGRGRPKKDVVSVQEDASVKSRGGRPPKPAAIAEAAPATPKRGRPARTAAIDLNRVAGSPRVGKRSSPRTKAEPVARRLDPRVRSKLRARLPPAKNTTIANPVPKPTARRGRPPKNAVPVPKQAALAKPTKHAKPLAPRKMRGHTIRQIPDRYIAQVDKYLLELMEADVSPVAQEHVEEAQEEDSIAAEDGHDALVSSEQDREEYQEYNDDGGVDMDGQQDGAQDEEHMQAIVTQQEEYKDELPDEHRENDELPEEECENDENAEPVHQIQISIQEDVEMEQDADGNVVHAEIETDIVVRDDSPNDGQDLLNGDEDGLISGTPRPFAAAIFS